ncbi:glycoside hydrolase family 3 N-terminal domain-containing protein [Brachybacterium sp. Z12]|uniref:glycoside hydrolase family 3 N-terminal domain-containing protein n=1 Tax=Brachybacterium sp. Z12 TaxID=2759167 RepID=UPI00223C316F|nr:glycoside hydrolase family 3 N-terminal domain-containing protein [Brachybacterium sp. Z12]
MITDALDMGAVAEDPGYGEAVVRAIEAGADLLCLGSSLRRDDQQMLRDAHDALIEAVDSGRIAREALQERAQRTRGILRTLRTRRRFVPRCRSRTPSARPSSSAPKRPPSRSAAAMRRSSSAPPRWST